MSQWRLIKAISGNTPCGQTTLKDGLELLVVVPFDQVYQFVHNNVLQALGRLFGELQIEPDAFGFLLATSPLRFHPANLPIVRRFPNDR